MQWTIRHPTDSTLIARYGVDPKRGGIYVEVEDDGVVVVQYSSQDLEQATRDVLETMVTFGLLHGDDVDRAVEWLSRPSCWRTGTPAGRGVRAVLEIVERLRLAAGE